MVFKWGHMGVLSVGFGEAIHDGYNLSVNRKILIVCFALFYGYALSSLPLDVFKDRLNYLEYAEYSWPILLHYWSLGPLEFFANEPLWLIVNVGLSSVFVPETAVRIIIFFPAACISWIVLRNNKQHLLFVIYFLLLPPVIGKNIIHLRQGLAIAVFLLAWFSSWRYLRLLLLSFTPFIHASFFFVLILFFMSSSAKLFKLANDLRIILAVFFGTVISVSLGWIASTLGARQGDEYAFVADSISGFGFVFWFVVLALMLLQGRRYLYDYAFEVSLLVFYLTTYFFVEVTARIFESGLLLALLAALHLSQWRRTMFFFMIVFYGIFAYFLRFGHPWLGFGFS